MRESDHDCVQSDEDFTYAVDPAEPVTPPTHATDQTVTVDSVKKNQGSGLDGLGGGRLK